MERLEKPEAKGILAFLSSTPPKSAENAEKEREEREKASAEKRAKVEHKRSELQALREAWGLQPMKLQSVVKVGRPSNDTLGRMRKTSWRNKNITNT